MENPVEGISQRNAAVATPCLSGNGATLHHLIQIMGHSKTHEKSKWKVAVHWFYKNAYFEINTAFNISQKGFLWISVFSLDSPAGIIKEVGGE